MNPPASRDTTHWFFLLLILLTIVVYYPGLSGDYLFDDTSNLLQNKALDIETLDMDSLQSAAYSSGAGMLRRPVSMASFALNRFFFGIDPYSHKVINLVIHILTGLPAVSVQPSVDLGLPAIQQARAVGTGSTLDSCHRLRHVAGTSTEPDLGALHRAAHDQPGCPVYRGRTVPVCDWPTADAERADMACPSFWLDCLSWVAWPFSARKTASCYPCICWCRDSCVQVPGQERPG